MPFGTIWFLALRKIGDCIVAEIGAEHENVSARTASELIVAAPVDQDVVAGFAVFDLWSCWL